MTPVCKGCEFASWLNALVLKRLHCLAQMFIPLEMFQILSLYKHKLQSPICCSRQCGLTQTHSRWCSGRMRTKQNYLTYIKKNTVVEANKQCRHPEHPYHLSEMSLWQVFWRNLRKRSMGLIPGREKTDGICKRLLLLWCSCRKRSLNIQQVLQCLWTVCWITQWPN